MFFKNLFKRRKTTATNNTKSHNNLQEDPLYVLTNVWEYMFGNDDLSSELKKASYQALEDEKDVFDRIQNFFDEHQGYRVRLENGKVKLNDYQFTIGYALEVVMISRSDVCCKYLLNNNFLISNGIGNVEKLPLIPDMDFSNMPYEEKLNLFQAVIDNILKQLDVVDVLFLDLAESLIHQLNKKRMITDNEYSGYSNLNDDYYFNLNQYPAITCSPNTNIGFNHLCTNYLNGNYYYLKGNEKYVSVYNILNTLMFYAKICSRYSNTALYIQNFQTILNCRVGENDTGTTLLKTIQTKNPEVAALITRCLKQITS